MEGSRIRRVALGGLLTAALGSCSGETAKLSQLPVQSCMQCHNASLANDYAGPGIENPHPFGDADNLLCTACHGGNPEGEDELASHVPPPPQIGGDELQIEDEYAWFNRLTLTGLDELPDYEVDGVTYSALDYLQFVNPGDLRVVGEGRSCGQCHENHVETVERSLIATSAGIFSGALFAIGHENQIPEHQGLHEDTAADLGFRAVADPAWDPVTAELGAVGSLLEFPVFSELGGTGDDQDLFQSDLYDAFGLADDRNPDGSVVSGSPLANLYHEQVAFTCGDCHLGSAGANDRAGDFRSSGCTACHMPYSLGGRSGSKDPNVDKEEPLDPDRIREPERAHVRRHVIQSIAQELPDGEMLPGIDDYTCAGCHQGSNRTVMQYWGIRLDQNEDLKNGFQYPANPITFVDTRDDERLFDPEVGNHTFNGRDGDQYILFEDYDGDGRDDTPADVHYDAGMGCIDCHGSFDLHGGDPKADFAEIHGRMEQAVAIDCESCHGSVDAYAVTQQGENLAGETAQIAVDRMGNPLRHVELADDGNFYLTSKLTGKVHYVPQTRDVVVDTGAKDPFTDEEVYSDAGSYAMGRADGDPSTGIGPQQTGVDHAGFAHSDSMSCESCHAAWTNTCMGCHLKGEYDQNDNFSNITGERIVFEEDEAQFVYQSPIFFQLGVDSSDRIASMNANTKMFFQWEDRKNQESAIFTFSDRKGQGGSGAFPALSHNAMAPHSIRGRVDDENEGPRYCVACHLTDDALTTWGEEYDSFRAAMAANDFGALDFDLLQQHFGRNPGNALNSPLWIHMVAGLGTGLFLFDENGCAVNPLDPNDERYGCEDVAPADLFDVDRVAYDLDRIVDETGLSNASNNHPMEPEGGSTLRDGAVDPEMAGPLGETLIRRLTDPLTGIVLNSWFDADGTPQGDAPDQLSNSP